MADEKVITINDRIPKLREQRKQRTNRRLIFFLSFFFLLILIIIYFQSPLSHIKSVVVEGNYHVSEDVIIEMSGLEIGTSIWNLNKEDVRENVILLQELSEVEINRKLPYTVEIFITEYSRIAYMFHDGKYFPILENGDFLDELPREELPIDAPILKNWEPGMIVSELASELTNLPDGILNRISEIYHTPTESDPMRITLYMNDGNEVHSTIRNFSERMRPYPSVVKEIDPDTKGIIHLRMTPYFEEYIVETDEVEEEIESESDR